ncbi:sister chromatid cohesion and DNA repair protein [Melanomma pulvis-pyrius CBS 109.77]|uniref:Sister chromatid cohesion and DNA repair protein n=1 Tax=Melanomma pulvis-pyrius CBS 109.77 TaxID=1314802 RepID=A0A6A6XHF1_9PLEO|nr:sister chromatid cohesion and DNA repair protein [Melanomma pulvis-pyrius CBS 109.77]
MARGRRSAATEVVVEEEEEQDVPSTLKFNQPLVGRPGKQVSVGDLLTRLKALCEELRGLEQDEADRESLEPVAKELAHQSLIQHKDAGVRAWTACCVVDMFRLCAPDAPYTAQQLKDIFTLIVVKIMPLIADPSNPYNGQHLYVLRSLAEFKSIVLLTDIPSSSHLTSVLFTTCFDVLSGPSKAESGEELSKNVEHHMTAVLSILIDEAPSLSSDVVDVIVAQFLWADPITLGASTSKGKKNAPVDTKQSTLRRKEVPPAYNMAKNLCNACPDKIARLIGTYFSSVIVDFTSSGNVPSKHRARHRGDSDDESDDQEAKGPSEDEINDASKAHRLLRELWRCAPGVLQDIIPHLQEELGTENVQLRQLATETFGDMISGIGAAGPPPRPELNPAAYPSQSLGPSASVRAYNFLTTPTSPNSFPTQHPGAYHSFLQRKHDKSPIIRASWATSVGRILMTSAGGVGLDLDEEQKLLKSFAESLIDSDERVRLATVRAIDHFEFNDVVQKLGSNGSMSDPGSVLSNLADRVKDKKSVLHAESMKLLGKIWGVAEGAIADGNERITRLLGPIPSRILEACYVNDPEINVQVDLILFEALLPLSYPPMKPKAAVNGSSQIVKDSQPNSEQGYTEADLDKIRAERQLVLVKGLEEKAKKVFFAKQGNQAAGATYMEQFLKMCEEYNGGVMNTGEKETKKKLEGLISYYGKTLPDSSRVVDDLWKFAKAHDRRSYQLIRFCMAPESDYRKVFKSIKELRKRIEDSQAGPTLLETLIPLVYRVSLLCYSKSHVPAIIEYTRSDDKGLGGTAHEVLKEISTKHPKVFKTHVKDLCKVLESEAPTQKTANPPGAVDDLKACAAFAKRFPAEVPINESRKLIQSFLNFARYGSPPKAAKHAVTIIMSSDNKKEMHAKELLAHSIKGFEYGGDHFLTKLASISQLSLLAPEECEDEADTILEIAVNRTLLKAHSASPDAEVEWMETPDDDMIARTWALRILVNRLRSFSPEVDIKEAATPVYAMLNRMVKESGEISKKKTTPQGHKNLQRILAANFVLKLSCSRRLDALLTPVDFNELALVTHDPCIQIRKAFATKLMKYLGQNRLPTRYYAILFLYAYEPDQNLKESLITWIRSRRAAFAIRKETTLETIFARLLSLLAHHPDFDTDHATLKIMSEYILFYLKSVATQNNISLIYHVAQRVKGVADGIAPSSKANENLYVLSDLAQALIRIWEEQNGWSMQSWPGKLKLPAGIFKPLESHERAQEIADKVWVDEDLSETLESVVRSALKNKKRKAADGGEKPRKKAKVPKEKGVKKEKVKSERPTKTPKSHKKRGNESDDGAEGHTRQSSGPRRKSDRRSNAKSYVEVSSDEEDDTKAGAQEEENEDEEMAGESESEKDSPAPEEDVEMANQKDEPILEVESEAEPEPEPEPPKKGAKTRGGKKTNGVASSPLHDKRKVAEQTKALTPAKTPKGTVKGKAKLNGDVASSSPVANGTGATRRSGRTRS